jgi:hypothetical protein
MDRLQSFMASDEVALAIGGGQAEGRTVRVLSEITP